MAIGTTAAILGAGALGAAGNIYASSKAAGAANNAANQNNALLREMFGKAEGWLSPYMMQGQAVNPLILGALGIGDGAASDKAFDAFRDSTGYNFALKSGSNAVNSSAATRGLLSSGANLKALTDYGQNVGDQWYGRWFNGLVGQQGVGANAAGALAGMGNQYAQNVGANNNSAAGATGNAWLSGAGSMNSLLGMLAMSKGMGGSAYGSSYGGGFGGG